MKKGVTQTSDSAARAALDSLSKAALIDLVIDLLRRIHGESLDGADLVRELHEAFRPLAIVRCDSIAKLARYAGGAR